MLSGFGQMLCVLDALLHGTTELVVAGDPDHPQTREFVSRSTRRWVPDLVVASRPPGNAGHQAEREVPLLRGKVGGDGVVTAYVCRNRTCSAPVVDPDEVEALLGGALGAQVDHGPLRLDGKGGAC
jgi:uncharacterized protein YyaL (SSP411 family)